MNERNPDRVESPPANEARYRAALDAHADTLPPGVETRLRAMRRGAAEARSPRRSRTFLWGGLASAAALMLALATTLEFGGDDAANPPFVVSDEAPATEFDERVAVDDLALARELDLIEDLEFALWLALEGGDEGLDAG